MLRSVMATLEVASFYAKKSGHYDLEEMLTVASNDIQYLDLAEMGDAEFNLMVIEKDLNRIKHVMPEEKNLDLAKSLLDAVNALEMLCRTQHAEVSIAGAIKRDFSSDFMW